LASGYKRILGFPLHNFSTPCPTNGDSKKIWQTIGEACNKKKSSASIDKLVVNGEVTNNKEDIANEFNSHFSSIGEKVSDFIPKSDVSFKDFLPPPCRNSMFLPPVSTGEMLEVILNMKKGESQDVNDVPFKILKHVAIDIIKPLCHIYSLSIENGVFPSGMKTSKVVPIYKNSGSPLDPNYYRGIAIVDSFSKIFEQLVCRNLTKFLYANDFFDKNQFGFLKDRSTNHAVLKMINFISDSLNRGEYVVGVFLDAMKAFDSVNHEILFSKLENAGIRGIALLWFKSYISGRNQKVKVGESWSDLQDINISVLQGSILGVILFVIFINDLHNASNVALQVLFADDNSGFTAHKNLEELNKITNTELDKICSWYTANKLAIHPAKSKFILFKSQFDNLPNQTYFPLFLNMNNQNEFNLTKVKMLENIPNSENSNLRVLGVLFDQNLNLSDHTKALHAKLSRGLYSLRQVKNIFSTEILKLIYNANFQSHLNYCSNILSICNKTTLDPIIKIQKKAIRIVDKKSYNAHTGPIFKEHGILPVEKQIEYSSLLFMHDYLNDRLSTSFEHTWVKNLQLHHNYQLRNADDLHIKPHKYEYLRKHPFLYFPSLWNDLDINIKQIESKTCFANKLKSKLFESL